jgi:FAD/FMN-containing dehydrogenase/Fe-S oxidoreductase
MSIEVPQNDATAYLPHTNLRNPAQPNRRVDARSLAHDLRANIAGEVRFDAGSRALYAADASHYRQAPIGVVIPRSVEDVVAAVALCRHYDAPILSRGGGTSLAGQGCNVAVVIDFSKYLNQILALDPQQRIARVQPGLILDDLRHAAEQHHLTFGPDPATHDRCTLGGMIGNDSCGVHSVMAGKTVDNIEEMEILTYDGLRLRVGATSDADLARIIAEGGRRGEVYQRLRDLRDASAEMVRQQFPHIPRRVSGYNLDQLLPEQGFHVARALVGSESTCVMVLEATVKLVQSPPARVLVVLGYDDIVRAADHVPQLLTHQPIGLEGFDHLLVRDMRRKGLDASDAALLPAGQGWLMVEFGADTMSEAEDQAHALLADLQNRAHAPDARIFTQPAQAAKIWAVREAALAATAFVPGQKTTWPGWEDSAVAPDHLGSYLHDIRQLLDEFGYHSDFYGHFGQGCIHMRIDFDLMTAAGIQHYHDFVERAADIVVRHGGSLSGEHGDGQSRAELLPHMYSADLIDAFRTFKSIWDPQWRMNPGKVVNAYRLTDNLRQGTSYRPLPVHTYFQYPNDGGDFAHATLRCVGVGKCRRTAGGTMCPSFMVTREESATTRGRAHALFEMLQGNPIRGGWRDDHVRETLDLCLACKGCKGDCPVNVDMATYKAEFLAHYYEGRLRPRSAYAMGWIYWWARLAALAPGLVNVATHAPGLGALVKRLGGIAPQRQMPVFAPQTFTAWFRQRPIHNPDSPQVLLWPDTFNNHFHPATAQAAVEVLEAAGYQVVVPAISLCCGRPLYDFGMLDQAQRLLQQILATLRPQIRSGMPVVGLEPSCVSVFRDDMLNLLPHDEDAQRLAQQTFLLSEFLMQQVPDYQPPQLPRRAVVHGHCHHKSVLKMDAETALLDRMGLEYHMLDSGCCGMAGAFGFEADHYDISRKVGERVLLPAVRQADADTLIITDGFSCRTQIAQETPRRALHLAEVLQLALHPENLPAQRPEDAVPTVSAPHHHPALWAGLAIGAGSALACALAWGIRRAIHR